MKRFATHTIIALALGLGLALAALWMLSERPNTVRAADNLFVTPISRTSDCTMSKPCLLQTALNKAVDGDTIYLAKGTYTSNGEAVVVLTKTIKLYGGWNGLVTKIPRRYPETNLTILDGEGQRRVVRIIGNISPTLDGLIITGGDGGGLTSTGCGGGIHSEGASPIISNNVISDNVACANCGTDGKGGGIYLVYASTAIITGNIVVSNTASTSGQGYGGGIYVSDAIVTLNGNLVQGNTASTGGDGKGGGVYLDESLATLVDNTVLGNTASTASWGDGGGLYLTYQYDVTLTGNTLQGNTASAVNDGAGGGVSLVHSDATLDGNTIVSNTTTLSPTADGWGGGLWVGINCSFTLTNDIVADNHANTQGSGMWLWGTSSWPISGQLLHTTIANNHSSGEGVFVGDYTTLAFTNTIIAGHSGTGITVTTGSAVALETTLWYNSGPDTGGGGTIEIGDDNIYEDPAFANPASWDYHLTIGSPAIDAGTDAGVTTDIDGDARPWPTGGICDIGADEMLYHLVHLPLVVRNY